MELEDLPSLYQSNPDDFHIINDGQWVEDGGVEYKSIIVAHNESGAQLCIPVQRKAGLENT